MPVLKVSHKSSTVEDAGELVILPVVTNKQGVHNVHGRAPAPRRVLKVV